jgi:hypothetical protein
MALFGLRVVRNADGGKLTWSNAVLRFIGLLVAFACIWIGVIRVAFDARKRGWHDVMGGTVVVQQVGDGSASDSRHRLNVRQGATAGLVMSFVLAASAAGSSTTPVQTFVLILGVVLTVTVVTAAAALAIDRQSIEPRDR